jgi:Colicin V production protein
MKMKIGKPTALGNKNRARKILFVILAGRNPKVTTMILWLIALLLFVVFGYAGYSLGAIRLSAWLLGLIVAAKLAPPLGHLFYGLVRLVGITNPVALWFLGPLVVFLLVLIIFKVAGMSIHQQVDVYYKYKAGDVRMGLFNRLNARLGIAVGLANAAVYLILISWVIYVFSYWTTQMATGDQDSWSVRQLNSAGRTLQSSGMSKVAAAVDHMPESYYQAADIAGLIYHNDLLESRLTRYPGFLDLAETPEFQDIGNDKEFTELRQRQPPISEIINDPKAQSILGNPDTLRHIWAILTPNLTDLETFLKTGASPKYDPEKILGRWDYDLNGSLNAFKRSRSNIGYTEMQRDKQIMALSYVKTSFVATPEPTKQALLKDYGKIHPPEKPKAPPTVELQAFKGTWASDGDNYQLVFPDRGAAPLSAVVDGNKMTVTGDAFPMVFEREN